MNAALNILSHSLDHVGVVYADSTSAERFAFWLANESLSDSSTPEETALPMEIDSVPAKRVHQIPPESDWLSDWRVWQRC
jgi:putative transposase